MSKKMVIALFLGLLASASSLIASLFMLMHVKNLSTVPAQIQNINDRVSAITTDIDVSPINQRIDEIVETVNTIGADVQNLKASLPGNTGQNGQAQPPQGTGNNNTNQQTGTANPNNQNETQNQNQNQGQNPTSTPPQNTEQPKTQPEVQASVTTTADVKLRTEPGLNGKVLRTAKKGEKLRVIGDKVNKDGYTWVKVADSSGKTAWVASNYIK